LFCPMRVRSLSLEHETRTDEFVDFDLHPEQAADQAAQTRRALGCGRHQAGESHLGGVGHRIEILERAGPDPDHGADIGHEPVRVRPVVLTDRPRVRPSTKEQLQESMIEDVEKTRKGIVVHQVPGMHFFGRRQRKRALRTQQSEKFDQDLISPIRLALEPAQVRGREVHIGVLPQPDVFVAQRCAPRRCAGDPKSCARSGAAPNRNRGATAPC